jgi:hypothetical protein
MEIEYWGTGLFFLMYDMLFCIWWVRAIHKGEFD